MEKHIAIASGIFGVLIIASVAFALINDSGQSPIGLAGLNSGTAIQPAEQEQQGLQSEGDVVKISLSEVSQSAKWHAFDSQGVKIKYLAVKGSDGSVRTAFDACDVCFGAKKGYRQEGSFLVCNNCGKKFAIGSLNFDNKAPRGCWPGYLPNAVENGFVVVKKSDLESGKYRFA